MCHRLAVCALLAVAVPAAAADYPKVELKAGRHGVTVYTPDAEKGFYRGSRFAWAGVVKDLKFAGYTIFGPWKDKHDPRNNDDITGPAEEFGMFSPLGYDVAKTGGRFVKIGVGEMEKTKEEKYSFITNYKVVNPGVWEVSPVKPGPDKDSVSVRCQQTLKAGNGYAYVYAKTITLRDRDDYAFLTLEHELTNTGDKPIDTDVYNHNFFNVDGRPIGPDYFLVFIDPVKPAEGFNAAGVAEFRDLRYMFSRTLEKEAPFGLLLNQKGKPQEYTFQMTCADPGKKTGVRVQVSSTQDVSKFQTWSVRGCMCPEPFSPVKVAPGKRQEWTVTYMLNKNTVR
ncbi:MAG TPA: hypothetical protein VM533_07085 [Fimbriiglobus sp.]|nr:hypothetical protein [Fimbriiglobus sp.]